MTLNFKLLEPINEPTEDTGDDLKIVFIPKKLHDYFECVVGKHVFVDKPWTKISYKKIIDYMQSENSNSCFWKFRKKLEVNNIILFYVFHTD